MTPPRAPAEPSRQSVPATTAPRGLVLRGRVITGFGAGAVVYEAGVVLVGSDGTVVQVGRELDLEVPAELQSLGGPGAVICPGLVDAHVHLAFGAPADMLAGGIVAVRDLGAPWELVRDWQRADGPPLVAVSGPVVTAPGGYPSRGWGAGGFSVAAATAVEAVAVVRDLVAAGADLVKVALEPSGGQPVPSADVLAAVVTTAHEAGLAVTCHALTSAMVERALDAGVDELCHVPVEPLPAALVERIAVTATGVVSTLVPLRGYRRESDGAPSAALANAAALVEADADLAYGTDLGNTGTRVGVDARELRLLAEAGLGNGGALRAATEGAAGRPGLAGRVTVRIVAGAPASALVLAGDPMLDLDVLSAPVGVVAGGRVVRAAAADLSGPR